MPLTKVAKVILGSAVFALFLTLLATGLSLYGVVDMPLARVFFIAAWLVAVAGTFVSDYLSDKGWKHVATVTLLIGIATGAALYGLDRHLVNTKAAQEAKVAPIHQEVRNPTPSSPSPAQPTPKGKSKSKQPAQQNQKAIGGSNNQQQQNNSGGSNIQQQGSGNNSPNIVQQGAGNTTQIGNNNTTSKFTQNITGNGNTGIQAETLNIFESKPKRVIPDGIRKDLTAKLKEIPNKTLLQFRVFDFPDDDEVQQFAGQLAQVFHDAGWEINPDTLPANYNATTLNVTREGKSSISVTSEGFYFAGEGEVAEEVLEVFDRFGIKPKKRSVDQLSFSWDSHAPAIWLAVGRNR